RMRQPALRNERVQASRRAAPGGCDLLDRRPRVDKRPGGQTPARQARQTHERRHDHRRVDRGDVRPGIGMMVFDPVAVDELLLVLKIAVLVLLYLVIWLLAL